MLENKGTTIAVVLANHNIFHNNKANDSSFVQTRKKKDSSMAAFRPNLWDNLRQPSHPLPLLIPIQNLNPNFALTQSSTQTHLVHLEKIVKSIKINDGKQRDYKWPWRLKHTKQS